MAGVEQLLPAAPVWQGQGSGESEGTARWSDQAFSATDEDVLAAVVNSSDATYIASGIAASAADEWVQFCVAPTAQAGVCTDISVLVRGFYAVGTRVVGVSAKVGGLWLTALPGVLQTLNSATPVDYLLGGWSGQWTSDEINAARMRISLTLGTAGRYAAVVLIRLVCTWVDLGGTSSRRLLMGVG
jgi:hypothetical protein